MPYGQITRIEVERGFGFIHDDSGQDWFFVREGVRTPGFEQLWTGERVAFAKEWTPSGPRATDIHHEQLD
ncbi:MAG: cold-shock protein [Vicinamibacteria bacterium]